MAGRIRSAAGKAYAVFISPRGEAVRYIVIGGFTTLIDYAAFYLLTHLLGVEVNAGNAVSAALAVCFAYVMNKIFVFQSRTKTAGELTAEFMKFVGARLFTMGIEICGVYLFVNIVGQDKLLGKAQTIVIVIILNYFLSKFMVFRKKKKTK